MCWGGGGGGGVIIYWSFSDKGQRIRQGQILRVLQPQRKRTVFLTILFSESLHYWNER